MDKDKIIELMTYGRKIAAVPEEAALKVLREEVTYTYIKAGVNRTMGAEAFKQEVAFCAKQLREEMLEDRIFSQLRLEEVHYILSEGIKGRLGTDKDVVLTFKSIVRWMEAYVMHPIKREAAAKYWDDNKPAPKQLTKGKPLTDDERRATVKEAWEDYKAFREKQSGAKKKKADFLTIGDTFELPFLCYDRSGMRLAYMKEKGFATDEDTFVDVLERAYANGGKFVKVKQ